MAPSSDPKSQAAAADSRRSDPKRFLDLFHGKRLLWQVFFGSYVVGLDRVLPITTVTCLDDGSDFDLIRDECNVDFSTVDQLRHRRTNWVGCGISEVFRQRGPAIAELLRRYPKGSWLLTSSPACPLMRTFCDDLGYRYVGTPPESVEQFKHKARLFEALDELELPRIRGSWLRLGDRSYQELASEFGSEIVVQQPSARRARGRLCCGPKRISTTWATVTSPRMSGLRPIWANCRSTSTPLSLAI